MCNGVHILNLIVVAMERSGSSRVERLILFFQALPFVRIAFGRESRLRLSYR